MKAQFRTTLGKTPNRTESDFASDGAICNVHFSEKQGWKNEHLITATKLLAQFKIFQQQLKQIVRDMQLLTAMENALDVVTENLTRIDKRVRILETLSDDDPTRGVMLDEIKDLLTVVFLIEEDTVFDGNKLFEDGMIRLATQSDQTLFLKTSSLAAVNGLEEDNLQRDKECLSRASADINIRYKEICRLRRTLQSIFDALDRQFNELLTKTL